MLICKCCGNIIDPKMPNTTMYLTLCPMCKDRPENKKYMDALEEFCKGKIDE